MKLKIVNKDASEKGSIELPQQFKEPVRKDLIKRAVLSIQRATRQAYGASPEAGKRASAFVSKRRRKYKGTYGIGQSRTPRKVMTRSGTRFYFTGAFAPQTVGGRRAHPPKADKIWEQKINEKENRKAIRSALASTVNKEIVKQRGHKIPETFPFIVSDDFQKLSKTSDVKKALLLIGFKDELKRGSTRKIRAGQGTLRGRKYKNKKTFLFVVSENCALLKGSKNIPGSDIVLVENLNAELLAPGTDAGRLTLYTESAIKKLTDKKLFTSNYKGEKVEKTKTPKKESKESEPKKKTTKKTVKKIENKVQEK